MLTFKKNQIKMTNRVVIYCLSCLRDITDSIKVEVHKETYCSKCASRIYADIKEDN